MKKQLRKWLFLIGKAHSDPSGSGVGEADVSDPSVAFGDSVSPVGSVGASQLR